MDRREWQDKRRDSAKTRGENWLRQNAQMICERTIGEEFYQLALANNMSVRYQQSLRITLDGLSLTLELDYSDQDGDVPLGLFFEEGTKEHWIEPVEKKALHWIQDGKSFFSKGHEVSGIQATHIMRDMIENAMPQFKQELATGLERFYKESEAQWQ